MVAATSEAVARLQSIVRWIARIRIIARSAMSAARVRIVDARQRLRWVRDTENVAWGTVLLGRNSSQRLERPLRSTDAKPAVGERDESAKGHHQCSDPDEWHERVVIESDRPSSLAVGIAQGDVKIRDQICPDAGCRGLLLSNRIKASFAVELGDKAPVTENVEDTSYRVIVGPGHVADRSQA